MTRWSRTLAAALAGAVVLPLLAAAPASADEPPGVPKLTAQQAELFPANMRFLVHGSDEFASRYFGSSRASVEPEGVSALSPLNDAPPSESCTDRGGDIGLYTIDFVRHLGDVLEAVSNLPGPDGEADDLGFVTTPWPGPPAGSWGGAETNGPMPLRQEWSYDQKKFAQLATPQYLTSCGADLAQFGQASDESPWGFKFYSTPDQGSIDYVSLLTYATDGYTNSQGTEILDGSDSWNYLDDNLGKWSYSPMRPMEYCKSGDAQNPLCLTAMFLHCPDPLTTQDPDQATQDCWRFNMNTILLNIQLGNWLNINGYDGRFHDWLTTLDVGSWWPTVAKWITFGVAVAAGVYVLAASGGLAALGLGRLAALIGVGAALTATDSWSTLWDVAVCSAQIDKCLAEAAAKGLSQSAQLVSNAASVTHPPVLSTASSTWNRLAGISAIAMLIMLFLTLCYAVLSGKSGMILTAAIGAFRWAMAIGLGAAALTLLYDLSNAIADAISSAGTASGDITGFMDSMSMTAMGLGGETTIIGWLMVAIAAVVGTVAALVVWIVLSLSQQFIPLAIGLMILQVSGFTGTESARKWIHRGWGALWTILLLRPAVTLLAKFAEVAGLTTFAGGTDLLLGFLTGIVILLLCAVAPWLVVKMFPTLAAGSIGAVQGLLTAANVSMMASRLGGKGGGSRQGLLRSRASQPTGAGGAAGGLAAAAATRGRGKPAAGGRLGGNAAGGGLPGQNRTRPGRQDGTQTQAQRQQTGAQPGMTAGQTRGDGSETTPRQDRSATTGTGAAADMGRGTDTGRGTGAAEQAPRDGAGQRATGTPRQPAGSRQGGDTSRSSPSTPPSPRHSATPDGADGPDTGQVSRPLPAPPQPNGPDTTQDAPSRSTPPTPPPAGGGGSGSGTSAPKPARPSPSGGKNRQSPPPGRSDDGTWGSPSSSPDTGRRPFRGPNTDRGGRR